MKLICPGCGAQIPEADINITTGTAACAKCHAIIEGAMAAGVGGLKNPQGAEPAAKPERFEVRDDGTVWTVQWRWFNWTFWVNLVVSVVGVYVIWVVNVKMLTRSGPSLTQWTHCLFGLLAVWMLYSLIAQLFNRTVIALDGTGIVVKCGPVPCPGGVRVVRGEIERVVVMAPTPGSISRYLGPPIFLWLGMKGGKKVLLGRLMTVEEGRFVGREIGSRLGIEVVDGGAGQGAAAGV